MDKLLYKKGLMAPGCCTNVNRKSAHIVLSKGLDMNPASVLSEWPVPGHASSQNVSLLICQRDRACLTHQWCRLSETTCVNCLAKSVFIQGLGGGCWWREEWAVNSSSRLVLEVEHLGRTFTPFSVKPVWSSYPSIHASFTLFTHICMYSFILLFIQPFFTEDLAACKRLLMQRWTKQVVSLGGCKRIAWMQRWHLASLSTVLCVGFLDIKTWQHGTIKLSPRIKGTKEVDVLHMSRVE